MFSALVKTLPQDLVLTEGMREGGEGQLRYFQTDVDLNGIESDASG